MEKKNIKHNSNGVIRTVITNAICGEANHTCQTTIYISSEDKIKPNKVLGCTITNTEIDESVFEEASEKKLNIRTNGRFEVHVWFEVNGDTKVAKSYAKFSELIPIENIRGDKFYNKHIHAWINRNPVSLGTMIVNKSGTPTIAIQVEYDLGVEVIGEARLSVLAYPTEESHIETSDEILLDSLLIIDDNNYSDDD